MVLGGQSFEELLAQLGQAHQRELQELRAAAFQAQARAASGAFADGRHSQVAVRAGIGSTTSSAFSRSANSSVRFDEVLHQEVEEELDEADRRRPSSLFEVSDEAGGLVKAQESVGARMTKSRTGLANLFESYEPRFIDFKVQCLQFYPDKQWDDLEVHEKVVVIRDALKPRHYMINPFCHFVRVWGAIHAFTLAFVGLVTPYEVVFLDSAALGFFLFNRIVDALFLTDIILQFFLQVEIQRPHRGGSFIQRDPWTCRRMYLRSWFFVDLVSIVPFDVLATSLGESSNLMRRARILRCLKLLRLAKLVRLLRPTSAQTRWKDSLGLKLGTQKLIKFVLFLMMFSHWMACTWSFCGLTLGAELCDHTGTPVGSDGGGLSAHDATWATTLYTGGKVSPDSPCDHFAVYVAALHWAVMTLTSIGYGDIAPVRLEEYIVCIVCMVAGGMLWAYVIGCICSIISNASPVERNFEMKTDLLNLAMDEAKLPLDERDKYRAFLQEAKAYDRRVSFGLMTESFSPMLRKQLMFHITKESMTSVYYFNDPSAPPSFLLDVASCLSPRFFSQLESLDHLRHCLCMIDRGTVAHCGRILLHPNVFHEDFIVSSTRFQKVTRTVSLTYTQLLVLTRPDMEGMLAGHPAFRKKIRKFAVKTAFIQAVHITMAAYQKWKKLAPEGSVMSLRDAFDKVFGAPTPDQVFGQSCTDPENAPPSKQRLAAAQGKRRSIEI